ncbi:TPA: type II toxin-antitoxin system RelE/ParE family toxin [Morganella morganii]|nr:type II toxin-antitoxin system RelE/ParE family toxin [Morganella morganii]
MYNVKFSPKAEKELKKLDNVYRKRLLNKLVLLKENPRSGPNIKSMQGTTNRYRYRMGDIRAIYDIIDDELVVLIVKVGWRGDIYD